MPIISRLGNNTPILEEWFSPWPIDQLHVALVRGPLTPQADTHQLFVDHDWQDGAIRRHFIMLLCNTTAVVLIIIMITLVLATFGVWQSEIAAKRGGGAETTVVVLIILLDLWPPERDSGIAGGGGGREGQTILGIFSNERAESNWKWERYPILVSKCGVHSQTIYFRNVNRINIWRVSSQNELSAFFEIFKVRALSYNTK